MKSNGSDEIKLKILWSHEMNDDYINDVVEVLNKVFPKYNFTYDRFKVKYLNNIYGDSLFIMAYDGKKCVGVRPFWRNDIENIEAYQPCDTAVLSEYRGRGLFKKMTLMGLEIIGDKLIYNFPNPNSLPGYLKMGWKIIKKFYLTIDKKNADILPIPKEYLKWGIEAQEFLDEKTAWLKNKDGNLFLAFGPRYKFLYVISGILRNDVNVEIPEIKFGFTLYFGKKGFSPFGREIVLVGRNITEDINIPIYKHDRIFF